MPAQPTVASISSVRGRQRTAVACSRPVSVCPSVPHNAHIPMEAGMSTALQEVPRLWRHYCHQQSETQLNCLMHSHLALRRHSGGQGTASQVQYRRYKIPASGINSLHTLRPCTFAPPPQSTQQHSLHCHAKTSFIARSPAPHRRTAPISTAASSFAALQRARCLPATREHFHYCSPLYAFQYHCLAPATRVSRSRRRTAAHKIALTLRTPPFICTAYEDSARTAQ
jgi:hypothetical protein